MERAHGLRPRVPARSEQGVILGTAAYMSPEQASGSTADKRADIWSFGVVLFETLTGKRAFDGETVSHVLAAVLNTEPDWAALPTETPAAIHTLLRRCLAKGRRRRVPDIGIARLEIDDALTAPATKGANTAAAPWLRVWQRPMPLALAALAFMGLVGLALGWTLKPTPTQPAQPVSQFAVSVPSAPESLSNQYRDVAISRDGARVVYRAGTALHLRALDQLDSVPLRGAEHADHPFLSPDGAWVGFIDERDNTLKKVPSLGGPPEMICEVPARFLRGASWGPDDMIIFGTIYGTSSRGLLRVSAAGGEPQAITTPVGSSVHQWPEILPGGAGVLFTVSTTSSGATSDDQIALLDLATGEHEVIIANGFSPQYSPTGHIVYSVAGHATRRRLRPGHVARHRRSRACPGRRGHQIIRRGSV